MKKLTVLWLFQAMVSLTVALGADPIPRADGPPAVVKAGPKFPDLVVPPPKPNDPPAPVNPSANQSLDAGTYYVVRDEVPFRLYVSGGAVSGDSLVTVRMTTGPVTLLGKFVDGDGTIQERTFSEKSIAVVLAKNGARGTVELITDQVGATDDSKVKRRTIDVNGGQGPIPPPKPVDPDKPKPVDPVVVKSFRVIMVYESGDTLPAAANSVLYGKAVEDFLNANCTGGKTGWARRDKDATGEYDADRQAVWNAVKDEFGPPKNTKTPALVIQVNDKITIEPFAATAAATVTLLKKYAEGK